MSVTVNQRNIKTSALVFLVSAFISGSIGYAASEEAEPVNTKQLAKADALFIKGHKALDAGNGQLAETLYRKAIELNPEDARYHRQLSLVLLAASRGQEAERQALLALHLAPNDWRSLLLLGNIYHGEGRLGEETSMFKKAIELMPVDHKVLREKLVKAISQNEVDLKKEREKEKRRQEEDEALRKRAL